MTTVHVLPVNDLREHVEGTLCWCRPRVEEEDGGTVVIHNSMDGRELIERGERSVQ
jgi:hypothetical protein